MAEPETVSRVFQLADFFFRRLNNSSMKRVTPSPRSKRECTEREIDGKSWNAACPVHELTCLGNTSVARLPLRRQRSVLSTLRPKASLRLFNRKRRPLSSMRFAALCRSILYLPVFWRILVNRNAAECSIALPRAFRAFRSLMAPGLRRPSPPQQQLSPRPHLPQRWRYQGRSCREAGPHPGPCPQEPRKGWAEGTLVGFVEGFDVCIDHPN